jgi:ATP-dependent Lon protease
VQGETAQSHWRVAFDGGAKRKLLPMATVKDIPTIRGELFAKLQTGFYADPGGSRVQGAGSAVGGHK